MTIEELNSVKRIREEIEREETRLESLRGLVPTSRFDDQPRINQLMSMPERVTIAISEAEATLAELANALIEASAELAEKIFQTFADNPLMSSVLTRSYVWKVHNRGLKRLTAALTKTP